MDSLKLSFEAIVPIFILMLIGYVIKCFKLADKKSMDVLNRIVFKIFLPVLLFDNIYNTNTGNIFDWKLIVFTTVGVLAVFVVGYFAVMHLTDKNSSRGVILQGFFRGNFAILGIPIVNYICGENSGATAALMVAYVIPVFNVLAVIALERFRDESEKTSPLKVLKGIVLNPLIIGCIIGTVFFAFGIKLPKVIEKPIDDMASAATPLAIISLGFDFDFSLIKGYAKENIIVSLGRLVIIPLVMMPLAVYFGFSGEALACLLVVFGSPVAVSSFAMSQQMGGDEKLCAQIIVLTSALCLLTLFVWIYVLSSLGLF
ncbi:MAG: AEC family transporter [Ruminococcaceae bacterium]|nr:AEC family transporter [Oscillospiraceae bacterium]